MLQVHLTESYGQSAGVVAQRITEGQSTLKETVLSTTTNTLQPDTPL